MLFFNTMSHLAESMNRNWQCEILPAGTFVYNAVDTKDDVINIIDENDNVIDTYSNKIELWKKATSLFNNIKCCNKLCNSHEPKDIVGAHVVLEKECTELFPGDLVYIIPICRSCNSPFSSNLIILNRDIVAVKLVWIGK